MTAAELGQYFTPVFGAEIIIQRRFPHLNESDIVLDPSCGDGRFLLAIPDHVQAFGVEIDAVHAQAARVNTGREIVCGDFRHVSLPAVPTAIVGNPPFKSALILEFLSRCHDLLEYGGRTGFILPAYFFQTAASVVKLSRQWSISQELIPRNLFEGLAKPTVFAVFEKSRRCVLSGFMLYEEVAAVEQMHPEFRSMFIGNKSRPNVWRDAVEHALQVCGGRATLKQIYACIEGNRPTENPWWREKVRQIAGTFFHRVAPGEFRLEAAA